VGRGRQAAGGGAQLLAGHHHRVGRPARGARLGGRGRRNALPVSERSTVKARNLAADPRAVLHLESGEDVLIVRGVAEDLGTPAAVPSVVAALAAKYTRPEDQRYLPGADPDFDVIFALRPQSAMTWRLNDYAASQRRWSS